MNLTLSKTQRFESEKTNAKQKQKWIKTYFSDFLHQVKLIGDQVLKVAQTGHRGNFCWLYKNC